MILFAVTKSQVIEKLVEITVENKDFNPDEWSIHDAELFEKIAAMIKGA